jgi:hypothetical protein
MADDIDRANDKAAAQHAAAEAEVRYQAQHMAPGEPGDCELCGEWSARLVGGACAACRDKYRLP